MDGRSKYLLDVAKDTLVGEFVTVLVSNVEN